MMKKMCHILALALIVQVGFGLASSGVYAMPRIDRDNISQQKQFVVTGTVFDNSRAPLEGASVVEKGTTTGTMAGADGKFNLKVSSPDATLTVSFIGYASQDIAVDSQNSIDVVLELIASELDEIVVVAYGTQKKSNLTGSVSTVDSKRLTDVTTPDVGTMLQGKAAGVYVSSGSGQPGTAAKVQIRGVGTLNSGTDPLWVVDGVVMHGTPSIAPEEIASVSVLKDASATALYGARAANGVLVITTKSAKSGVDQLSISVKYGVNQLNNGKFNRLNSQQVYDLYGSFANPESIPDYYTEALLDTDTDWFDIGTDTGITEDYIVTFTGGSDKSKTYLMGGYYKEEGAVKGYTYDRVQGRLNLDYKVNERFNIKPKISGNFISIDDRQHSLYALYTYLPWDSPYKEDGSLMNPKGGDTPWYGRDEANYLYDLQWNYSSSTTFNLNTNINADYKLCDDVTFISTNNITFYYSDSESYSDYRSNAGEQNNGELSNSSAKRVTRFTNQMLKYRESHNDHTVNALVAYEYSDYAYESTSASGKGIAPGGEILDITSEALSVGGTKNEYAFQSVLFNANYVYNDRYMAQFSFRRDGSSKFGDNSKYGNFVTFSGGWNIHNEEFFSSEVFNKLKLRASFGSIGNTPKDDLYGHYGLYSLDKQYGGDPAAYPSQMASPDLTWEKAFESNVAVDTRIFNRVNIGLELYSKVTSDLLYAIPLSTLTGYTSVLDNIGEVKNRGVELIADANVIKSGPVKWNIGFNIGSNKNEVSELYNNQEYISGYNIIREGEEIGTWYMRRWAGVDTETGGPQWEIVDEDSGEVTVTTDYNDASLQIVGSSNPAIYGGFNTDAEWNGFTLSANFNFITGLELYHSAREFFDTDGAYATYNQMQLADGWSRWEKPGDVATHPLAYYGGNNNSSKTSSRYIEDGGYLRLKSVTLNYSIPQPFMERLNISRASIFMSADNLLTVTNFSGADPETDFDGEVDRYYYPVVKKIMFGLNVTF